EAAVPLRLKTPEVEEAIPIDGRMRDIEESNTLGRALEAQADRGHGAADAEAALGEGRVLHRIQALEAASVAHLSEADSEASQERGRMPNEPPEHFAVWVDALKKVSDKEVMDAETFAQFVQRQGRINSDSIIDDAATDKLDAATLREIEDAA